MRYPHGLRNPRHFELFGYNAAAGLPSLPHDLQKLAREGGSTTQRRRVTPASLEAGPPMNHEEEA